MGSVSDLRKGLIIGFDKSIYEVADFLHVNPGKGQAFVRTTLKNLETGSTIKQTFKKGDDFDLLKLEERETQYLYKDDINYFFMDLENFEQYAIEESKIDSTKAYLREGMEYKVRITEGRVIGISLPNFVTLTVTSTEPGVKGNTAQGGTKPAVLETGTTVKVPLFIDEGDEVVIDTRTGDYSERK
ncbi:elongation factor P [candidate division WOR-3 bacterium]|jgi:elongation factor P|nr:elongation factor P [candidate division WOR-3 bacterium]